MGFWGTQWLGEKHRKGRIGQDAAALIEVITGPDGVARCGQQLFNSAEHEVRGIDAPPYAQARDGSSVNSSANMASRGVRSRFIYGRDNLTLPAPSGRIERDLAHGEEVRILPQAPMKIILADGQAGLIPLVATPEVLDSCILVRPSALLDALSALFETLWQQAQPYVPDGLLSAGEVDGGPTEDERRILSLLAVGLSDDAIARQLGIGLRTVQRRVQALLVRLGAGSRFQAGVLAADRGWWRPQPRGLTSAPRRWAVLWKSVVRPQDVQTPPARRDSTHGPGAKALRSARREGEVRGDGTPLDELDRPGGGPVAVGRHDDRQRCRRRPAATAGSRPVRRSSRWCRRSWSRPPPRRPAAVPRRPVSCRSPCPTADPSRPARSPTW